MNKKCHWCPKDLTSKISFSFGWMDEAGEWRDRHYTCADHTLFSIAQQNFRAGLAQSAAYGRLLFDPKRRLIVTGSKTN